PGSTYKPFMALAALTLGKRTPQQTIYDPGYFQFGNHRVRDDKEGGHGTVDMYRSIVQSCDTYYYMLANDMGVDLMHDELVKFGFGELTGIDIFGEVRGVLPSTAWKRRAYKRPEQQRWYAGETISLGIGQGYNNFTMLQLALATSVIANDGVKMKPHLVKEVVDVVTRSAKETLREIKAEVMAKPANIAVIQRALAGVTSEGTGATAFKGSGYLSAGKTGTAQVVTIGQNEKYNANTMPERYRDNALYMAYAPVDKPQIALALVLENAGWGGAAAAPIARRVFDYWLMNQYPNELDLAAVQKGQAQTPLGQPRAVADVPGMPVAPAAGVATAAVTPAIAASATVSAVALASAASMAPMPQASAASAAASAAAAAKALHKSRR
ncbi:MAG: penicillin-binding protein 2, partial [Rhodoferax sp.]|nr:penicillin-binding protein 2 [Rhodoferax sp.]